MATFKKLEEIIAWQKARAFCAALRKVFPLFVEKKEYELLNQLKSAAGSVMDNIAEGFGRMGNREFCNFLTIANGSVQESISQPTRAYDWELLTVAQYDELKAMAEEIARLLQALIMHLQHTEHRGIKFKAGS